MLNDREIKDIIINQESNLDEYSRPRDFSSGMPDIDSVGKDAVPKDIFEYYDKLDQDDDSTNSKKTKLFLLEIQKDKIETLQKRLAKVFYRNQCDHFTYFFFHLQMPRN